jgi:pimeloyl-ACP methyl ester carboxylesterase
MQERKNLNKLQWFDQYRASKTVLFWACAGSMVLATVVGFSWGGWVTGGTAEKMADKAAAQARQELIAGVCVDRFLAAPDAGNQLTALQEMTSAYAQGKVVLDGGWAVIPVSSSAEPAKPVSITDQREAAELCAADLAQREVPTPGKAELIDHEATAVQ